MRADRQRVGFQLDGRRVLPDAGTMSESILAELTNIEAMLDDDCMSDPDRFAIYGAQQALRNILELDVWQTASQSFYRLDARPYEPPSKAKTPG